MPHVKPRSQKRHAKWRLEWHLRTHGEDSWSWEDQESEMNWTLQANSEKAQQGTTGGRRLGQAHGYLSPKGCQEVQRSEAQMELEAKISSKELES